MQDSNIIESGLVADNLRNEQQVNMLLARGNLGLFRPINLSEDLKRIAQANNLASWSTNSAITTAETAGYFLGHEIACKVWKNHPNSPARPFNGLEKLTQTESLKAPQTVLLLGCAGIESYNLQQLALKKYGIVVGNHWTVDISNLPLERIKSANSNIIDFASLSSDGQSQLLQGNSDSQNILMHADASQLPFSDDYFDLVVTDLFFSNSSDKNIAILKEMERVLKRNGEFIIKLSFIPEDYAQSIIETLQISGYWWNIEMKKLYGEDSSTNRDGYIGLNEEQWMQLGEYYGKFVHEVYMDENRFRTHEEIQKFFKIASRLRIDEEHHIEPRTPIDYSVFKFKKI